MILPVEPNQRPSDFVGPSRSTILTTSSSKIVPTPAIGAAPARADDRSNDRWMNRSAVTLRCSFRHRREIYRFIHLSRWRRLTERSPSTSTLRRE
jgi:hypothetical protein